MTAFESNRTTKRIVVDRLMAWVEVQATPTGRSDQTYSSQTSVPFLSFVHLHFLSPEELTHFFFILLSTIKMAATVAPDAPPTIARVLPEIA